MRFPLHLKDPEAIFAYCKQQLDFVKLSPAPLIGHKLTSTKGDLALDIYGKVTAMLSNIPGPSSEVRLAGQALDDLKFYALGPIGLYFGIVSYNGHISIGVACDRECE